MCWESTQFVDWLFMKIVLCTKAILNFWTYKTEKKELSLYSLLAELSATSFDTVNYHICCSKIYWNLWLSKKENPARNNIKYANRVLLQVNLHWMQHWSWLHDKKWNFLTATFQNRILLLQCKLLLKNH